MRIAMFALGLLLLLAGCGGNAPSPGTNIAGSWATTSSIPGSGTQMTLRQNGSSVFGTGTYQIEAGRSGTIVVAGDVVGSNISLTLTYDTGAVATYQGAAPDANHLSGLVSQAGYADYTLTLTRQQ